MTQNQQEAWPQPGRYIAKLIDYGVGETNDGRPKVLLYFEFSDGQNTFRRAWQGSVKSEKSKGFLMDALKVFGFNPAWALSSLADGCSGGPLDLNKRAEITIGYEEFTGNDGQQKTAWKINWVNPVGGQAMANRLDRTRAAMLFGEVPPDSMPSPDQQAMSQMPDDEVPF